MPRPFFVLVAALLIAAPPAAAAQSTSQRERERIEALRDAARERAAEERERAQELAEEERERARELAERAREQARDRVEREQDRRERAGAGALDTVVAFDARGSVTVTCPGGDIVVTASDRNEIRVRARTERGGIRFSSSGGRATIEPASGQGCGDGRFEVTVPTNARVSANSWTGSVEVRGVRGEVEARTQSGNVDVRDAGDRVDIEALSGDVTVAGVRGDIKVHSLSGDVSVEGARGVVEVETVSGDIGLDDITSTRVRTHSTSGDLAFAGTIAGEGRYEFGTHSGNIRLHLPSTVGAQLTVSTYSGGIESDFPITLKAGEHGIGVSQAKRVNFALGQGSARIVAETFSGDVILSSTPRRR